MTRTLQKHGNSQALVIEKPLMEAMGITMETKLEITVDGDGMTIRPANVGFSRAEMDESFEALLPRYEQMLRNLAK